MSFSRLIFDGDFDRWANTILNSSESLLLCGSPDVGTQKGPDLQGTNRRAIGLFTSATTGQAKCIWNSYDRLALNARITAREFEITDNDKLLMMAKPWHVAGLSWVLMAEQLNVNYSFIPTKKGETERWHSAIRELRPTYLLTVPAVLRALLDRDEWEVPNIVFGGAPMDDEEYKPLTEHCEMIYQGYGQTEAGGLISCRKLSVPFNVPSGLSANYGVPPREFELKCKGSQAHPAPIMLESPTAIHRGFYDTGDLGYLKDDGSLVLAGRAEKEGKA
jgi:acyl-coenzyme A synthetase/AMP-(fatty) acid ligase